MTSEYEVYAATMALSALIPPQPQEGEDFGEDHDDECPCAECSE